MIELENKANPMVKNILDNLSEAIEVLKKEILNIEDEYRKKLEDAKKALTSCLEETQKQYDYWSSLSEMSLSTPVKKRRIRAKPASVEATASDEVVVDPEPETVVDDKLPFDNPEQVQEEPKTEAVVEAESPTAEEPDAVKPEEEQAEAAVAESGAAEPEVSGETFDDPEGDNNTEVSSDDEWTGSWPKEW